MGRKSSSSRITTKVSDTAHSIRESTSRTSTAKMTEALDIPRPKMESSSRAAVIAGIITEKF